MERQRTYVGLGYWMSGMRHISQQTKPLIVPTDAKGLKFRVQTSDVCEFSYDLGHWVHRAQPMAFAEVYRALQTGVVDASGKYLVKHLH